MVYTPLNQSGWFLDSTLSQICSFKEFWYVCRKSCLLHCFGPEGWVEGKNIYIKHCNGRIWNGIFPYESKRILAERWFDNDIIKLRFTHTDCSFYLAEQSLALLIISIMYLFSISAVFSNLLTVSFFRYSLFVTI